MRIQLFRMASLLALACGMVASAQTQKAGQYRILRTIELGGDGSWDYLRFLSEGRRLFITRSTRVMVVDLANGKLAAEIPGTDGVHGVAFVPSLKLGVTSNGKANTATIFERDSLKAVANVATGTKPDGILWDPFTSSVLTMNGADNSISVIDAAAAKSIASIALPGRPETAASDAKGKVFVNLEDKAQIAEVSMTAHSVTHTWDLAGCVEPTGLAMDKTNARLFTACHNGVLIVVDANSGRNIQKLPIGAGVDAVEFDPETRTIFTSNKEGTISVIQQDNADKYHNQETVQTLPGAKTMALDHDRHLVYTVANQEGKFVLLEIGR